MVVTIAMRSKKHIRDIFKKKEVTGLRNWLHVDFWGDFFKSQSSLRDFKTKGQGDEWEVYMKDWEKTTNEIW